MKQSAYIFDVDGVLNDLHVYQPDQRVIKEIASLLDKGSFVAINTGRGYAWVEENVVRPLRGSLQDSAALTRLFVAVEMGGLGIEFVDGEERKMHSAFSLTDEQIAQVREVFEQHPEYASKLHWYEGKESMGTLAKNDDVALDDGFRLAQRALTDLLREAFEGQHVQVANSNDAIDVQAPEAGKWAGAQLVYDWLQRASDIQHDHFVCFGDSAADYEMARFFAEQDHDTVFVYTGPGLKDVTSHDTVHMVQTEQLYNEGTYQYLATLPQ